MLAGSVGEVAPPSRLTLAARGPKTVETFGDFYRDRFWTACPEGQPRGSLMSRPTIPRPIYLGPDTLYLKLEGHNRASNQSISNHIDTNRIPMKKSIILEGQIMILSHPRYVDNQNTKIKIKKKKIKIFKITWKIIKFWGPARPPDPKISRPTPKFNYFVNILNIFDYFFDFLINFIKI